MNHEGGDRPGVDDVLILFTDGYAHDLRLALTEAELLKKNGVRIITIAAGEKDNIDHFRKELQIMASDPVTDALTVDFKDISNFANEVIPVICPEKKKL